MISQVSNHNPERIENSRSLYLYFEVLRDTIYLEGMKMFKFGFESLDITIMLTLIISRGPAMILFSEANQTTLLYHSFLVAFKINQDFLAGFSFLQNSFTI